jgi:hypothetical protein
MVINIPDNIPIPQGAGNAQPQKPVASAMQQSYQPAMLEWKLYILIAAGIIVLFVAIYFFLKYAYSPVDSTETSVRQEGTVQSGRVGGFQSVNEPDPMKAIASYHLSASEIGASWSTSVDTLYGLDYFNSPTSRSQEDAAGFVGGMAELFETNTREEIMLSVKKYNTDSGAASMLSNTQNYLTESLNGFVVHSNYQKIGDGSFVANAVDSEGRKISIAAFSKGQYLAFTQLTSEKEDANLVYSLASKLAAR